MMFAIAGLPMNAISVVSYQFVSEITYPVSEVQAVSFMNTVNKFISFVAMQIIPLTINT
jgi:hypothetical protein